MKTRTIACKISPQNIAKQHLPIYQTVSKFFFIFQAVSYFNYFSVCFHGWDYRGVDWWCFEKAQDLTTMYKCLCLSLVQTFQAKTSPFTSEGLSNLCLSSRLVSPFFKHLKEFDAKCSLTVSGHSTSLICLLVALARSCNLFTVHYQSCKIKNKSLCVMIFYWQVNDGSVCLNSRIRWQHLCSRVSLSLRS